MICRILLLIILTSCVSGSFVVNVTQTSYQAEENHNITLEWTFTTKPDSFITSLKIRCSRPELSVLYQVHEGVEVSESQDAKFSGRVQSDKDALREGRIRLQLSGLRTDDSGLYRCEVKTNSGSSFQDCKLSVTAADEPKHQTPTMNPQTESRGRIGLYAALILTAAAAALLITLSLKAEKRKCKHVNSHSLSSVVTSTSSSSESLPASSSEAPPISLI
ncbi:programmed cell death 1 ligand 1 [Maylandia zebra]|uniref:programmed cell death 1 ligand 1 n=1 Tax=Maylandia zebra TaxID=106582 RepID=UPI00403C8791